MDNNANVAKTNMNAFRYDGFQHDLFGGGVHCYTVMDEKSPAFGYGLVFETTQPSAEHLKQALTEKESEILKAKEMK